MTQIFGMRKLILNLFILSIPSASHLCFHYYTEMYILLCISNSRRTNKAANLLFKHAIRVSSESFRLEAFQKIYITIVTLLYSHSAHAEVYICTLVPIFALQN